MAGHSAKIYPLGENALTVEFGNEISIGLNRKAISLADHFEAHPFEGFIEAVPAYASTTIIYDLPHVRRHFPEYESAFEAVRHFAASAVDSLILKKDKESRLIEIPVSFDDSSALDLAYISDSRRIERDEIIRIFTSVTYRVFMLGFLPGFAYMGEVDPRIAVPRKETPRIKTPKGSVGIAGSQTGIYPFESPGGWQIIGRTDLELFDHKSDPPCLLQAGDNVRFVDAGK